MAWLVEEQDNGEEATSYHLFEQDGDSIKMRAILFDKFFVQQVKSALEWQDALGTGMMKLAQDGITIDANGKIVTRRVRQKSDTISAGGKRNGVNNNPTKRKPNRNGPRNK